LNPSFHGCSPFGQEVIYVRFAAADCLLCSSHGQCTQAQARSLTFRPQARYLALQAARERQQTDAFKEAYALRAGVESTISQAVRVSDLRQASYFGLPKTKLQHLITATAINVRLAALALKQSKPAAYSG
jgi:DDE family transposase